MEENRSRLINTAFLICIIVIAVITFRALFSKPKEIKSSPIRKLRFADTGVTAVKTEATTLDIGKIKAKELGLSKEPPATMEDIYKNFPKEDVGENMVEAWARVKPEEKTRLIEGLDGKIADCKDILKTNPSDKRTLVLLSVTESLKKLTLCDFNYKKEAVPTHKR